MTETLLNYDAWAHEQVKGHALNLNEEQFHRDLGDGVGNLVGKLKHLLWAEEVWMRRVKGESPDSSLSVPDFGSPTALYEHWDAARNGHFSRLRSEIQANPGKIISYQTTRGESHEQPLWQIAMHVVNHGTFHRGQVSSMMRRLTGNPVPLDMILFHRSKTAAA